MRSAVARIRGENMRRMSARDAENGYGRVIDIARAEPVAIEKYGRSVVVVLAFEVSAPHR